MRARVDGVRGRPGVGRYEKEKAGGAGGRRRYSRGQGTLVARGSEREREMEGEGGGRGECPSRCGRYNSEFCLCPVTIWPPRQRTWATPPPPLTKHPALSCARRRPPLCNFTPRLPRHRPRPCRADSPCRACRARPDPPCARATSPALLSPRTLPSRTHVRGLASSRPPSDTRHGSPALRVAPCHPSNE